MTVISDKLFNTSRWIKATFFGWLLGLVFILLLSALLDGLGIEHLQFYLGTGMGAGVGFMQWRYLSKTISMHGKWFWTSAIAMSGAFFVFDLFMPEIPFKPVLSIAAGSLAVGLFQSRLLKNYMPGAYRWVYGSFAGWTLAVATVFVVDYTRLLGLPNLLTAVINLLLILAGGVVLGIVTGLVLKKTTIYPTGNKA